MTQFVCKSGEELSTRAIVIRESLRCGLGTNSMAGRCPSERSIEMLVDQHIAAEVVVLHSHFHTLSAGTLACGIEGATPGIVSQLDKRLSLLEFETDPTPRLMTKKVALRVCAWSRSVRVLVA